MEVGDRDERLDRAVPGAGAVSALAGDGFLATGTGWIVGIVVALVFNAGSFGLSAATVLFSRRLIPGTPVDPDSYDYRRAARDA